ncbi:MAG: class I SAM-dependent methyltransferase [Dehalococcoidia bacterium]|nr:class I SAM-dependent methyltransferase [Dehalococcoidia bacterium]
MNSLSALLYSLTVDRVLAGIRARLPDFCGMEAGDTVVDICCGTGAQSLCYARRGIISWGIDLDPFMIEFAEKRRKRMGLENTFFQRAVAMDLPFRDGAFDHASITMGLHEKERASRYKILSEMRRVVKKDGTLAIVDYKVPYPGNVYGHAARLIEQMAGQDHLRCFREFVEDGGLDSLLSQHRLHQRQRELAKRMPMTIVKVRNI